MPQSDQADHQNRQIEVNEFIRLRLLREVILFEAFVAWLGIYPKEAKLMQLTLSV